MLFYFTKAITFYNNRAKKLSLIAAKNDQNGIFFTNIANIHKTIADTAENRTTEIKISTKTLKAEV